MINAPHIAQAIIRLRPGAAFSSEGNEYEGIIWQDTTQTMPSKEETEAMFEQIKQEWIDNEYQRDRIHNYPPLNMLAEAIYKQYKGDNSAMEAYIAAVDEIRAKFPKPTA